MLSDEKQTIYDNVGTVLISNKNRSYKHRQNQCNLFYKTNVMVLLKLLICESGYRKD